MEKETGLEEVESGDCLSGHNNGQSCKKTRKVKVGKTGDQVLQKTENGKNVKEGANIHRGPNGSGKSGIRRKREDGHEDVLLVEERGFGWGGKKDRIARQGARRPQAMNLRGGNEDERRDPYKYETLAGVFGGERRSHSRKRGEVLIVRMMSHREKIRTKYPRCHSQWGASG